MLRFVTSLLVVLSVLAIAMPASADFVTDVTATAGGEYSPAQWLINNAGGEMSDTPVLKTSTMSNNVNGGGMWVASSPVDTAKWVNFTFANPTSLNEMVIWNFNQENPDYPGLWQRGLKDVTITYSTGTDASGDGPNLFGNDPIVLNHANGTNGEGYTDDLFVPGGPVANVKAVKIAYTTSWDDGTYTYNPGWFGLSEVAFDNGIATPEPGTIVLLTTGLIGLLAYAWRKRK
jgi:hypothetical protein